MKGREGARHMVVADNSIVVRKIVRRIFESMGARVSEATDGRQALAACAIAMPDAILIDANMPTLDPPEFLKQLRRMHGGERPKVVICLNEHDVVQIARAMRAGANDFMMKPFDADHVRSKFGLG